jgi:HEAT repeat protein
MCFEVIRGARSSREVDEAFSVLVSLGAVAVQPLITFLRGDPHAIAADALVEIGSPAVPDLIAALSDRKTAWIAAVCLGRIGDRSAREPLIRLAREGKRDDARAAAARALAALKDPAAYDFLIESASSRRASVRRVTADTLGVLGDPRAIATLRLLLGDPDHDVRWSSVHALARFVSSPEVVEDLASATKREADDLAIPYAAATGLAAFGEPGIAALLELSEDSDPRVRRLAFAGFKAPYPREIADERIVRRLAASIPDPEVEGWARDAVVQCRGRLAVDLLLPYLSDPDPDVRIRGIRAI